MTTTGSSSPLPQRGDVWTVRFGPSVGAEIHKLRPAVVVSLGEIGRLPLRIVVPLTDWNPTYTTFPWFVRVPATAENGLTKESGADAFQIKSLSIKRFVGKLGVVTDDELSRITAAIALCIGAPSGLAQ